MVSHQEQVFQKFKGKERLVNMVLKFNVSNSAIVFKIALSKLKDNYPETENLPLSLHYFRKCFKTIREISKENPNEFK